MLHCQNCGIQLPAGTTQCPGCGALVFQPSPPSSNQGSYNPPSWDGRTSVKEASPSPWQDQPPAKETNPPSWHGQAPTREANPPSWHGQAPTREANPPSWHGQPPTREANPPSWDGRVVPGENSPTLWQSQAPPGGYNPSSWGAQTQAEGGALPYNPPSASGIGSPALSSNIQDQPGNVPLQPPSSYANAPASMPPGSPPPSFSLTSPPPQAMSKRMFLTLVVLAVLVILSGISLFFYTEVARPAQLHANETATAQVASFYATGTAYVTVTAQARATVMAKATATTIQSVYAKATSGTPVFSSSLVAQDDGNWDVYDAVGGGGCSFTNGALHSTILKKSFYVPCFAQATNFSNFALEAQMTITKGDEGGLIFRANDAASKFYDFRVGRDGYYALNVSKDDKNSTPLIYSPSPAIKTRVGQMNLLSVVARGKNFYLYINQQFVASTSDGSYSSGEIGVFAGNNGNNTDVAFSNVRVWNL
jgi:hypothetical protein